MRPSGMLLRECFCHVSVMRHAPPSFVHSAVLYILLSRDRVAARRVAPCSTLNKFLMKTDIKRDHSKRFHLPPDVPSAILPTTAMCPTDLVRRSRAATSPPSTSLLIFLSSAHLCRLTSPSKVSTNLENVVKDGNDVSRQPGWPHRTLRCQQLAYR
jgi:hypothetical protein